MPSFPVARGSNLEGRSYTLPADFEGEANLVLIAFEQWQQTLIDTWIPFARTLAQENPALRYYELPVIQTMNPFAQRYVDLAMRVNIPDVRARQATITLYLDVAAFCRTLELPTTNDIYALLVTRDGRVLWHGGGAYTPAAAAQIRAALTPVV